jgi:CO/xanthine dehydrogenase FAD-binding subunit
VHPRPFEFAQARSVEEAVAALAGREDAKLIAGGQSLVPMMSLGLVTPSLVVDVNALPLAGVERRDGTVSIGALTRHRELERSAAVRAVVPLAAEAAAHVGNPRVRNRGTLGGSLAHADPLAELAAVVLAHGGRIVLAGPEGERSVAVDDFLLGFYATAARPDEVLVRAELEPPPPGSGTAFVEVAERAGDFATAGAAAVVTLDADGAHVADLRLAVLGGAAGPERASEAESACRGERLTPSLLERIAAAAASAVAVEDNPFGSGAHRRRCAAACASRAVAAAVARARDAA